MAADARHIHHMLSVVEGFARAVDHSRWRKGRHSDGEVELRTRLRDRSRFVVGLRTDHQEVDHEGRVVVVGNGNCLPYSMDRGEAGSGGGSGDRDAQANNLEEVVGHDDRNSYLEEDSHRDGEEVANENGSGHCGEHQVVAK